MIRIARLLPPALAALLVACASTTARVQTPELRVPETWHAAPAQESMAPAALAAWWEQFGDPLLSALVTEALAANPDLAGVRAALRGSRAQLRVASAALAPQLNADGSASRSTGNGGSARDSYSAGLDASWEVDLFGGRHREAEAAAADYQRAQAQLGDAQVSLAAEVALQYVALRGSQRRLAIARANLASQGETVQLTAWRVQAGLASSVELEQARASREQTAASIPLLETAASAAVNALATLTGSFSAQLAPRLTDAVPLPQVPSSVASGIPADTLRQRPDLRAAERQLAAASARVAVADANRYPSLRLAASFGSTALTLGALASGESLSRALLASLSATLFDGGRLQGQLEVQEAVREQALEAYRSRLLSALQEVEDALVAFDKNGQRLQALGRATESARNAALLARQRYQGGLIDFQTVLETERSQRSVEDSLAAAQTERVASLVRLYKALGGGWSPADAASASARSSS